MVLVADAVYADGFAVNAEYTVYILLLTRISGLFEGARPFNPPLPLETTLNCSIIAVRNNVLFCITLPSGMLEVVCP